MKHVRVQREKQIIIIEPAVERVVYVPYYDTRVVYGPWWWDRHPPVYWHAPTTYVHVGGFYWGPRISLGTTFFFSSVHWPQRRVVVIDYHHHHHHHPRFYSGRKIAHYHGARHWEHNPVHRRNIVYRSEPVRQRYVGHDGSRRFSNEWRNEHRDAGHRNAAHRDGPRDAGHRAGLRDEGRREVGPMRNEGKREFRNEVQERHNANRDRGEIRPAERRDQGQDRSPGAPREFTREERQQRAEQVRERLASNRSPEGNRPNIVNRPNEQRSQIVQGERREQWRERDNGGNRAPANVRQEEQRPRHNGEADVRREQLQRTQPQNTDRDWRAEKREQAPARHDMNRDWQERRAAEPARQERAQPPRPHQEQRRFEQPARNQRENHNPRPAEREQRRFER